MKQFWYSCQKFQLRAIKASNASWCYSVLSSLGKCKSIVWECLLVHSITGKPMKEGLGTQKLLSLIHPDRPSLLYQLGDHFNRQFQLFIVICLSVSTSCEFTLVAMVGSARFGPMKRQKDPNSGKKHESLVEEVTDIKIEVKSEVSAEISRGTSDYAYKEHIFHQKSSFQHIHTKCQKSSNQGDRLEPKPEYHLDFGSLHENLAFSNLSPPQLLSMYTDFAATNLPTTTKRNSYTKIPLANRNFAREPGSNSANLPRESNLSFWKKNNHCSSRSSHRAQNPPSKKFSHMSGSPLENLTEHDKHRIRKEHLAIDAEYLQLRDSLRHARRALDKAVSEEKALRAKEDALQKERRDRADLNISALVLDVDELEERLKRLLVEVRAFEGRYPTIFTEQEQKQEQEVVEQEVHGLSLTNTRNRRSSSFSESPPNRARFNPRLDKSASTGPSAMPYTVRNQVEVYLHLPSPCTLEDFENLGHSHVTYTKETDIENRDISTFCRSYLLSGSLRWEIACSRCDVPVFRDSTQHVLHVSEEHRASD